MIWLCAAVAYGLALGVLAASLVGLAWWWQDGSWRGYRERDDES